MVKADTVLTGVAGEYYVAAELWRKGYIASLTSKNTKGIDLLVSNQDGNRSASIQIKTNSTGLCSWILNKKSEEEYNDKLFYVFVDLKDNDYPKYYVVKTNIVADYIRENHKKWLAILGKKGQSKKDTNMRKFDLYDDVYKDAWDMLGLDEDKAD